MKVLQINTVCGQGSTGKIAVDLQKALEKNGHTGRILYGIGSAPESCKAFSHRIGTELDVKLHSAKSQLLDAEGLGSKKATLEAINHIEHDAPDLIHLHNIHGCFLHYPSLFAFLKEYKKPVIWTLHDCWPFTGHCAHFDYVGCTKWQSHCHHCPQSRIGYPRNKFLDASRRNFRLKKQHFTSLPLQLVCPSQWMANLVKHSFLGDNPSKVIVNGVDLPEKFAPSAQDRNLLLLAVSSDWHERKGLVHLQAIAAQIPTGFQLLVIGENSHLVGEHKRVECLAHTQNHAELLKHYAKAAVLLNPTLEDNMPLVNLEALACGTPVVSFDTGGIAEVVDNAVGAVVQKDDHKALLQKALELAPLKPKLSQACRSRAETFSAKNCCQSYIQLYEEVLQ